MRIRQQTTVDEHVAFLEEHSDELDTLYKELLIGVTKFFSHDEAYPRLAATAVPEIVAAKSGGDRPHEHHQDGHWQVPYRSGRDRVSGTVVTMIDSTNRKHVEMALPRQHDLQMRIFGNPIYGPGGEVGRAVFSVEEASTDRAPAEWTGRPG